MDPASTVCDSTFEQPTIAKHHTAGYLFFPTAPDIIKLCTGAPIPRWSKGKYGTGDHREVEWHTVRREDTARHHQYFISPVVAIKFNLRRAQT